MSNIKINNIINEKTAWADLVEEEEKNAPAAAGAVSPPPKEKGWTEVHAPKKGKKSKSRTTDPATAGVAQKLDFDGNPPSNLKNNKFAALAWSDSE
jgi:hypothetical protein